MRAPRTLLIATLVLFAGFYSTLTAQVTSASQIKTPPLRPFTPQEPKRIQLDNGMVIFLQEDHELPLIDGSIRIRGGGRDVPADKAGFASIYGQTWRTGGTKSMTGDQMDDYLEARAAKVETSGDVDSTSLSFSCLKQDFDDVFKLAAQLLRESEFREDKLALAKQQVNTSISRRNDDPGGIAGREARKLAYGADNPYARQPEYYTVAAIKRQDLIDFHKKYVHPNNIILGVAGDFDSKIMEAALRKAFESWPKGPVAEAAKVEFPEPKTGIYFVPKDDINQSTVYMVSMGIRRDNPDYYAISVMNELFGGGFGTRLLTNIRSKKGLAYSVGGGIGSNFDHPGIFTLSMGTKSGTTAESIDALREEIKKLVENPGTAEEVRKAKADILNSFIFRFDSKDKVMFERMAYEFYGYPADYLERYRAGIEKVTPADVERVVKKYVAPAQFATLVVGKAADFDRPLSSFGKVQTIDITIPQEPPTASGAGSRPTASAQPSASNEQGKALIAKMVTAAGGEDKLKTIKTLSQKSTLKTPQGEASVEASIILPDHLHSVITLPMGSLVMSVSPQASYMELPGQGVRDLPSTTAGDVAKDLKRDLLWVLQHSGDPKYTFAATGEEKIGDTSTTVLDINADGATTKWFVDAKTGQLVRSVFNTNTMQGPASRQVDFSDYRSADGVQLPYKRVTTDNGAQTQENDAEEIKLNPPIDPKIFEKPVAKQ
jgi:zinc protease